MFIATLIQLLWSFRLDKVLVALAWFLGLEMFYTSFLQALAPLLAAGNSCGRWKSLGLV